MDCRDRRTKELGEGGGGEDVASGGDGDQKTTGGPSGSEGERSTTEVGGHERLKLSASAMI